MRKVKTRTFICVCGNCAGVLTTRKALLALNLAVCVRTHAYAIPTRMFVQFEQTKKKVYHINNILPHLSDVQHQVPGITHLSKLYRLVNRSSSAEIFINSYTCSCTANTCTATIYIYNIKHESQKSFKRALQQVPPRPTRNGLRWNKPRVRVRPFSCVDSGLVEIGRVQLSQ